MEKKKLNKCALNSVTRKKHFSLFRFTLTFIQKKLKGTYPEF